MKSLIILLVCFFSLGAIAQDVPIKGFEWLSSVILMIKSVPALGKYLAYVFEFAAIASASLTALAVFLKSILTVPQLIAKWSGAEDLAVKIKEFEEKILPWVEYFSMFNVKK